MLNIAASQDIVDAVDKAYAVIYHTLFRNEFDRFLLTPVGSELYEHHAYPVDVTEEEEAAMRKEKEKKLKFSFFINPLGARGGYLDFPDSGYPVFLDFLKQADNNPEVLWFLVAIRDMRFTAPDATLEKFHQLYYSFADEQLVRRLNIGGNDHRALKSAIEANPIDKASEDIVVCVEKTIKEVTGWLKADDAYKVHFKQTEAYNNLPVLPDNYWLKPLILTPLHGVLEDGMTSGFKTFQKFAKTHDDMGRYCLFLVSAHEVAWAQFSEKLFLIKYKALYNKFLKKGASHEIKYKKVRKQQHKAFFDEHFLGR